MTWQTKTLAELCVMYQPKTLSKKNLVKNGEYYVYGANGIIGKHNKFNHEKSELLLGCRGTCGSIRISKPYSWINGNAMVIRPNENEVLKGYIEYYFRGIIDFSKITTGSSQPQITRESLNPVNIFYPSILEQRNIIAKLELVFNNVDELIDLETSYNKNKKSILNNYLSKIFSNQLKKANEKEYALGNICKIVGGGTPSKNNSKFYEGKMPWATVRDMKNDIIEQTQFKISKDAIINSSTNVIPYGNIVIATRVGLGKVCILRHDTAINQDLKGIIPINPELIDINVLFYWFKFISKKIINFGTGLTVQGVKLPFIKSLKINLPSINEQKLIVKNIQSLQNNINSIKLIKEKKIINLKLLKNSFCKKLLNTNKVA